MMNSRFALKKVIKERENYRGEVLVHVSDTPGFVIRYISRIVKKLGARYLIHTGDFIDNLKSSHPLFDLKDYEKKIKRFVNLTLNSGAEKIYLVPGNHDDIEIIGKVKDKTIVIPEGSVIHIGGLKVYLAHDFRNFGEMSPLSGLDVGEDRTDRVNYNGENGVLYLYGHNRYKTDRDYFLNGYCTINIVFLDDLRIFKVPYPYLVRAFRDSERRFRIGL